jgi:hypothetical protein
MVWVPGVSIEPEILPDTLSSFNPVGKFFAAKVMGRLPVAGIAKRTGCPGRTPNTFAPLILGFAEGSRVNL